MAMAEHERIIMSKYTEEFRRNAIELMKQVGITKACKELKVSHCTIYRWCRELEGASSNETDDTAAEDMDALIEEQLSKEQPPPEPDAQALAEADNDTPEGEDTIAMAMALLVIENTHLREVIRNLRDTISGLTDHKLL